MLSQRESKAYLARLLGGCTGSIRGVRLLLTYASHLKVLKKSHEVVALQPKRNKVGWAVRI